MTQIQGIDDTKVLRQPDPCAILYGASWCYSSLRLRDALAAHPTLPVFWVDIETSPAAVIQDNIQGIPTLVLHHNGVPIARRIGMQDADEIIDWLANHGITTPRATEHRGILKPIGCRRPLRNCRH